VVSSLEEAGEELFTFLQFPNRTGKPCALSTRSSASMGNFAGAPNSRFVAGEDAVLLLLYGLLRSGQIALHRIDGGTI